MFWFAINHVISSGTPNRQLLVWSCGIMGLSVRYSVSRSAEQALGDIQVDGGRLAPLKISNKLHLGPSRWCKISSNRSRVRIVSSDKG